MKNARRCGRAASTRAHKIMSPGGVKRAEGQTQRPVPRGPLLEARCGRRSQRARVSVSSEPRRDSTTPQCPPPEQKTQHVSCWTVEMRLHVSSYQALHTQASRTALSVFFLVTLQPLQGHGRLYCRVHTKLRLSYSQPDFGRWQLQAKLPQS